MYIWKNKNIFDTEMVYNTRVIENFQHVKPTCAGGILGIVVLYLQLDLYALNGFEEIQAYIYVVYNVNVCLYFLIAPHKEYSSFVKSRTYIYLINIMKTYSCLGAARSHFRSRHGVALINSLAFWWFNFEHLSLKLLSVNVIEHLWW